MVCDVEFVEVFVCLFGVVDVFVDDVGGVFGCFGCFEVNLL